MHLWKIKEEEEEEEELVAVKKNWGCNSSYAIDVPLPNL
jgi:hypothetical protein